LFRLLAVLKGEWSEARIAEAAAELQAIRRIVLRSGHTALVLDVDGTNLADALLKAEARARQRFCVSGETEDSFELHDCRAWEPGAD